MSSNPQGQGTNPAQAVRTEERVFGVPYERALGIIPKLAAQAMQARPEELADGFFVATVDAGFAWRREMTLRLAREGADTRVVVRVATVVRWQFTVLFMALVIGTFGLAMLLSMPWFIAATRKETRARELLVHRTFRAIEDAVAQQGEAPGFRVAPGLDAVQPARVETEAGPAEEEAQTVSRDVGARRL